MAPPLALRLARGFHLVIARALVEHQPGDGLVAAARKASIISGATAKIFGDHG
jgi:hypothetical protein